MGAKRTNLMSGPRLALVAIAWTLVCSTAVAQSPVELLTTEERFDTALDYFTYQDWERAAEMFQGLLDPPGQIADVDLLETAQERLAASLWYLQRYEEARRVYRNLVFSNSKHRPDKNLHVPELLEFFEKISVEVRELEADLPIRTETPVGPEATTKTIRREIVEQQPFVTTLIPFGVGQFENGDTALGTTFLVTETLALAGSIATYFLILDTRRSDPDRAKQFETAFWASQGTFLGLVVTGITEAMISYEGTRTEIIEEEVPIVPDESSDSGVRARFRVGREGEFGFSLSGTF